MRISQIEIQPIWWNNDEPDFIDMSHGPAVMGFVDGNKTSHFKPIWATCAIKIDGKWHWVSEDIRSKRVMSLADSKKFLRSLLGDLEAMNVHAKNTDVSSGSFSG